MVNIYRSRRGKFYYCKYWKRKLVGVQDNEQLIYNVLPSGTFYAEIVSSKASEKQDIANVFQTKYSELTIQTEDIVNIESNDIVEFDGELWIVGKANDEVIPKNTQFSRKPSKITTMIIRKGEANG